MARPSPLTFLPLLERALDEEIGIGVSFTGIDQRHFQIMLYEARKQSGDPRLNDLILFAPANGQIYICKKEVELDP